MSSKSVSKGTKKRKLGTLDPSQHKLDRFLSYSKLASSTSKDDPMHTDAAMLDSNKTLLNQAHDSTIIIDDLASRASTITQLAFDKSWENQKALVLAIFSSEKKSNINFVTISRLSESLCRFGRSKELYQVLVKEIKGHVQQLKADLLKPALRENLLPRLNESWNTFCKHLSILRNVFMELDRTYILPTTKFPSIIHLGKHVYSETILDATEFRGVVVAEVLKLIKHDRDNFQMNIKLIRDILHMLIELSYYTTDFEPRFLASTANYYKDESNKLIHVLSTKEYIEHAFKRRQQEVEGRVESYLDARTKQDLAFTVTNQLIFQKTGLIISKGFNQMMDDDMMGPLETFYNLLDQSTKMSLLRNAFGDYIKTQGLALIKEPSNDSSMISSLLKFKKKIDDILKNCFKDDVLFANALKESFESFINSRGNKPAELLAKFIDSKLKVSINKSNRNTEVDITVLDNALVLFRYIQSKDAFEAYYKRFLAKRLLLDRSVSGDIEAHVLEKLKLECGYEFTKNLETMFKDIKISSELNVGFKGYEKKKARLPINVKVIAQATWPTYPNSNIRLPHNMMSSQNLFEQFYTSKYNGRKLVWQNSLSSCSLLAQFPNGTKELILSLSQATILLLFNHINSLSYSEIKSAVGLDDHDLTALLKSLSSKPYPIIINGKNGTISKSDKFAFNTTLEAATTKIRIPPATFEQTTEEQKAVEKKVQINRQHQLEAAIVRIMKAKNTLSHMDLINEIFKQLNYSVEANDIKKRIESLIDRDYIVRDTEDSTMYVYQS